MGVCSSAPQAHTTDTIDAATMKTVHINERQHPLRQLHSSVQMTQSVKMRLSTSTDPFLHCIHTYSGAALLHTYMQSKYSEQHTEFWMEVQQYKQQCKATDSDIPTLCRAIYNKYIERTSTHAINITDTVRQTIIDTLQGNDITLLKHCYDAAERDVLDMIKGNYWYDFSQTTAYIQWLHSDANNVLDTTPKKGKTVVENDSPHRSDSECTIM